MIHHEHGGESRTEGFAVASCDGCRSIVTWDLDADPPPSRCGVCGKPFDEPRDEFPFAMAGVVILGLALWGWSAYHEPVATAAVLLGFSLVVYAMSHASRKGPHGS